MSVLDPRLRILLARWRLRRFLAGGILGAGIAGLALALWRGGAGTGGGAWLVGVAGFLAGLVPSWPRADAAALARHLDRRVPALQESAELLLADAAALTPLQRLQRERARAVLHELPGRGLLPWRGSGLTAAAGLCCLLLAGILGGGGSTRQADGGATGASSPAAAAATRLRDATVSVVPPAYTGRAGHRSTGLDVVAEEGAAVSWRLLVDGPAESAVLTLGDERVVLSRGPDGAWSGSVWIGATTARTSAIYALEVEAAGRPVLRSPSARLEVVPDRPPLVEIVRPPGLTEVAAEHPGALVFEATASDDYGLGAVELLVTTVTGGGEQIVAREDRLPLTASDGGHFTRTLDLAALGVRKDTELYLRVEAADRRVPQPNRTRSQTVRVRVPGVAVVPSAALDAGLALQPVLEFFRSERQIILDSEKLLADEPRIARREFEQRSQDLAFDQRALRLRYGALLGEEFESGHEVAAGGEEGGGENPSAEGGDEPQGVAPVKEGAARKKADQLPPPSALDFVPRELVHQHDSTDAATFFPNELRAQMKAVLAEMWGAEGELRVFVVKKALPFEYRALRLLKDLQQRARVYVPKIGYEAPEIDLKRRLTGELDSVRDLVTGGAAARGPSAPEVRRVLAYVDALSTGRGEALGIPAADLGAVQRALTQAALAGADADALAAIDTLGALAADPGAALPAAARAPLERALWRLLPAPDALPSAGGAGSALERAFRSRQGGTP